MKELYLDIAASAPLCPKVKQILTSWDSYANPSSAHILGVKAQNLLENARNQLAKEISVKPWELYFTSGVSEANSWVFQGLARAHPEKKKIIISSLEHASVREPCAFLKKQGYTIVYLPLDARGHVDMDFLEKAIDARTLLVSVMHVHNSTGIIQDISSISKLCKKQGVLFHTDAAQSFGKLPIKAHDLDLLSASSHKIGGLKGTGFLYIRQGVSLEPLIFGGGQERAMRGGTENVLGACCFAAALETCKKKYSFTKLRTIRKKFIHALEQVGGRVYHEGIPHILHVSFSGADAQLLVEYLSQHGIYASAGSACESKRQQEDSALKALGLDARDRRGSLRFSFYELEEKNIARVKKVLAQGLKKFSL